MDSSHLRSLQRYLPVPDAETEAFWDGTARGKFLLRYCRACKRHYFYPRRDCCFCWSPKTEWKEASGHGRVYSYTVIHHNDAPPFRDMLPYVVALVDLEEGVRVTSNLVECTAATVHVGMPVEVVFERVTDEITLPKFRPRT